ncbi:HAD-IA family hydrolase [Thalassomonas sp. M1454]|uniref:HAD-IA family hydrolase n=1 Tax=Thalassomonas sp. M1454 TaxID=2594477 RepID=UPI00117E284D|nr:HAD-IA family hydrolase [Thalassomonas sp. M1454]TRX57051.1 HAD-IA family hydrolase [Thalassomonas sp. M1454]
MNHYKLYIFDWDGTLMNSIDKIVHSLQAAAIKSDLSMPTDAQAKSIIGASLTAAAQMLWPGVTQDKVDLMIKHYKLEYLSLNNTPSPLYNNSLSLLNTLNTQDKLLAVATGKGRQGLDHVLDVSNTRHLFHSTRSSDDAQSKPHPDMLQQILTELNIDASDALMIGDSHYDLHMAKNANIASIGITHGAGNMDSFAIHQPKAIVHSIDELAQLIV